MAPAAAAVGNEATLDEAKCSQAKNANEVSDIKAFCPKDEWPPDQ